MKRMMRVVVVVASAAGIAFTASPLWAKKDANQVPPGQAKKQAAAAEEYHGKHHGKGHHEAYESHETQAPAGTPPGWSHGKKTGWHGSKYPPGWSKWDEGKRKQWTGDRYRADEEIRVISNKYKIPHEKQNEITGAFNEAIAGGLVVNDAKNRLVNALENEASRKSLMIDTTQSVLELLK
jgi:hypothetical protein